MQESIKMPCIHGKQQCLALLHRHRLQLDCRGRLRLVVTDVLSRRQLYLKQFTDREDLITANMASIHIPLFLDYKPFSFYRYKCMFIFVTSFPHFLFSAHHRKPRTPDLHSP